MSGLSQWTRARAGFLTVAGVLGVVLIAGSLLTLRPWVRAALLLADIAEADRPFGSWARLGASDIQTEDVIVSTRYGVIPGRLYLPHASSGKAVLLVHGLHAGGISEERLGPFARRLATRGISVLTPEMEELRRYRISSQTTDKIEDSVAWLLRQRRLVPGGKVGLIGISFSGGLSIVAAGRRPIRDSLSFVMSIGGHGDLYRASRYLATGEIAGSGAYPKPHDYGVGILLLNLSRHLVPAEQEAGLSAGVAAFLGEHPAEGHRLMESLPSPASQILRWVENRDAASVGPMLVPHLMEFASDPNLSPERSSPPAAPVFLLHGQGDNLIPADETKSLARHLQRSTRVEWLITPLISHVELERSPARRDLWEMTRFLAKLFEVAYR